MANTKVYKDYETLKLDIAGALYDLMRLKKKTAAEAQQIAANAVSRPELITEYTLLRALLRLSIAHKNRSIQMPPHWAERLGRLGKAHLADAEKIIKEVEERSRLENEAKKPKRLQPKRPKLR